MEFKTITRIIMCILTSLVIIHVSKAADDNYSRLPSFITEDVRVAVLLDENEISGNEFSLISQNELDNDNVFNQMEWGEFSTELLIFDQNLGNVIVPEEMHARGLIIIGNNTEVVFDNSVYVERGIISIGNIRINGTLNTKNDLYVFGDLSVEYDINSNNYVLDSSGELYIGGNLECMGLCAKSKAEIQGDVSCNGWILCKDKLYVQGKLQCGNGSLQVFDELIVGGDISCEGYIFVAYGALRSGGNIECERSCISGGGIKVDGYLDVQDEIIAGYRPGVEDIGYTISCMELLNGKILLGSLYEQGSAIKIVN